MTKISPTWLKIVERFMETQRRKPPSTFFYFLLGLPVVADDSGLNVDALDGAPGVKTARYAETLGIDMNNIDLLLEQMEGVSDRSASFHTTLAYTDHKHFLSPVVFDGVCKGEITKKRRGTNGFGYDTVFQPDGYSRTFAEMEAEEKEKISHRTRAVQGFVRYLKASNGLY